MSPSNRRRREELKDLLNEIDSEKGKGPPPHLDEGRLDKKVYRGYRRSFSGSCFGRLCVILIGLGVGFCGAVFVIPLLVGAAGGGQAFEIVSTLRTSAHHDADAFLTTSPKVAGLQPKKFAFVHISRCAGSSWITLLRSMLPKFHPKDESGGEFSLQYTAETWPDSQILLNLKSPRRHVWSLFTKCKYDEWGRRHVNGTKFPNAGDGKHTDGEPSPETDDDDFVHWMQHFLKKKTKEPIKIPSFGCYHPSNMQSRHLVSKQDQPFRATDFEQDVLPSTDLVMEKYNTDIDWTGITEFFHESKCLLFWRYTIRTPNEEMYDHLEKHCRCDSKRANQPVPLSNAEEVKRDQFHDMPSAALDLMDSLTSVDRALYQRALVDFIANVIEMELDLEREVLCDATTKKHEAEMEYILVDTPTANVTDLVQLMRSRRTN